jgi:hypothetical protein
MEATMAQKHAKTTDGSERASGYIRDVADAAKAGVDKASDYLEGVTDQTVEYVTGAMNETQEQVAAFGSRRIDDVWADVLRYTKRRPGMALLIAGAVGLTLGRLVKRGGLEADIDKIGRSERGRSRVTHLAQGEGP